MTAPNPILSAVLLKALMCEDRVEEILQRKQEGPAALSQAVSPGEDITKADGETMTAEAWPGTLQPCV